jgi:hypothetical protein
MKTYGLTIKTLRGEEYSTRSLGWSGQQSRKVANRLRKDKRRLHKLGRTLGKRDFQNQTRSPQD